MRETVRFHSACDPSDGTYTKLKKRLLFLGEIRRADDGFVYECAVEPKTGAVIYRAKSKSNTIQITERIRLLG